MEELIEIGRKAKKASGELAVLHTEMKNGILLRVADLLISSAGEILKANKMDLKEAGKAGLQGPSWTG